MCMYYFSQKQGMMIKMLRKIIKYYNSLNIINVVFCEMLICSLSIQQLTRSGLFVEKFRDSR